MITINEALVTVPKVRERLNELKGLRDTVAISETILYGEKEQRTKDPKYDVKKVDERIVKLEKFLWKVDKLIKASNAVTSINVEFDENDIFEPLQ